ncbi:MAG: hypothetical protein HOP33_21335 [Verrucomicrobia bacterium]|nr:hypothetical protein [Verrucomicrobiota bacterium]
MRTIILLFALAAFAVGCGQKSNEPQSKVTSNATKVYSEVELNKLIVPGMSIAEVTNTFGIPASEIPVNEKVLIFMYSFPFETVVREGGLRLTGFDVNFRDGKVVDWSPVMGESRKSFQAGESQDSSGDKNFQIFLATDGLTNVLNKVESEGSADASDLKTAPDMTFTAKIFSGKSGSERPGEQTVILVVSEQDVSKLKELSENSFGKRLLIVCRNRVIAAPTISAPLASRQLLFTVKDSRVLDSIQNK